MKPTPSTPLTTTPAEMRRWANRGFRYDPDRGYINTRDPWWLPVWVVGFCLGVAILLFYFVPQIF